MSAEQPSGAAPPPAHQGRDWRSYAVAFAFLAPTLFFLGIWIVYPTIRTIIRSFFDRSGDRFVGFDNYQTIFTSDVLLTAVKNNAIWVLVGTRARDRDRARLRGPHGADRVVGRLQDGGLHADGYFRLCGRGHLANHVPAGPGSGSDQRRDRGDQGCRRSAGGALGGRAVDRRHGRRASGRHHSGGAGRARCRRPARAHTYRRRRGPRRLGAGHYSGGRCPVGSRASSGGTSSLAVELRARSKARKRGSPV